MASGFVQRFKGKVKAGQLWLDLVMGTSLYDSYNGLLAGGPVCSLGFVLQATAAASTDFTWALPPSMTLLRATVFTTVAFTAATDAKLSLGVSAGDATYVTATSIKAIATVALTINSGTTVTADCLALPALVSGKNLFGRIAQTGSTTATGTATLVVEFA